MSRNSVGRFDVAELTMVFLIAATLTAGIFAGAAIYVSAVEHPARVSCGTEIALREFAPSYRRGAIMQASLGIAGCVAGVIGGWLRSDMTSIIAALLLGTVVAFTLIVISANQQAPSRSDIGFTWRGGYALVDALGTTTCGQERNIGGGFPDFCDPLARARRWLASHWHDKELSGNLRLLRQTLTKTRQLACFRVFLGKVSIRVTAGSTRL